MIDLRNTHNMLSMQRELPQFTQDTRLPIELISTKNKENLLKRDPRSKSI